MALWERILFTLILLGSAGFFLWNLHRKIRVIRDGAPDRPRTGHLAARLRRTLREVLAQTRVIGGRPVVGALHAVVFFGFLLFALETIEHFLQGFGISCLEPLLGGGLAYFRAAMAGVAVLVIVAVAGLAFRRFVMVRTSPDPRSWTSALVALFIVALMATYLNGVRAAPLAPGANWWAHSLVILAFPHLILRSKHFHILLAPAAIFLRGERLGEYTTLDLAALAEAEGDGEGEVKLGLEDISGVPWKMRLDFLACVECRRCTDVCPAAKAGGGGLNPRGFILAGRKALLELGPDDPVIGNVVSETALGACATCGACQAACPVGVEHLEVLVGAKRAQALATGQGVVAGQLFRSIEVHGNALSRPRQERQALLAELGLPKFTGAGGQWLLWLGCVWGYNRGQRDAVAAFQRLLEAAGVGFGVLEDEPCCGHHSRRQGEEAQFQDLARRSIEALRKNGVRRVVTPCPHCLHTLRRDYAQLDGGEPPLEVVHHSELLSRLIRGRALPLDGPAAEMEATFHDPCYLARFENISEAPREVLAAAGVKLRELPHRRERTLCCGGGAAGFVREQRIDQPRRAEIGASGVPLLVTACPECRMMLDATLEETRDIAEVVARALRRERPRKPMGGKGGAMSIDISEAADLEARILKMFAQHPDEDLQLLGIAAKAHFSGRVSDLKHAAGHLEETGALRHDHRDGASFYHLAAGEAVAASRPEELAEVTPE